MGKIQQIGSVHTEQHALSYTRELYLLHVWFTLLSAILFTPSDKRQAAYQEGTP